LKPFLRKYTIEISSRRARVSFELHDRRPIVAAIERAVLDPSAETSVVPQFTPDLYAKIAGVRIYKTWRQTATAKWTKQKKSEERHPGNIRYRVTRMTREPARS
jgi:hypothetical protein